MPQLNPSPWFLVLLFIWTSTMLIYLNKTLTTKHPNIPTTKETKIIPTFPWTWPWF